MPIINDSHNIVLNFTVLADGSTLLNFGADEEVSAIIEVVVNNTIFNADITAVFIAPNTATIEAVINNTASSTATTVYDSMSDMGLYRQVGMPYQNAKKASKKISEFYQKGLTLSILRAMRFEKGLFFANGAKIVYQQGMPVSDLTGFAWDEAFSLSSFKRFVWENAIGLSKLTSFNFDRAFSENSLSTNIVWQEAIRLRKLERIKYQKAVTCGSQYELIHEKGLSFRDNWTYPWDKARSVYYRKSSVPPWFTPPTQFEGSPDLNFVCLLNQVDSNNLILNFGVDDCIPQLAPRTWWHIVNNISVTRLSNGAVINVLSGDYQTSRDAWCWSYRLNVPTSELSKLNPVGGDPVIIQIVVNGFTHLMLLENRTKSRTFGRETYTLTGRNPSALLDSPASPTRAFLQENERTSVQLAQAEIDRSAYPDLVLNWDLIDELGWILPTESMSYNGLTPIKAIKMLATAAGGFVFSEPDSQEITIKPLYKKVYWDLLDIPDYDILLPDSFVTEQSTDYQSYPLYNAITLTNDKTGLTAQIKRAGTAGDVILETVNDRLFTSSTVTAAYGKAQLAKAGLVETHTFSMGLNAEVGQCLPSDVAAFNGEWWGIVDSVSVSFTYAKVTQSVTIERVNNG